MLEPELHCLMSWKRYCVTLLMEKPPASDDNPLVLSELLCDSSRRGAVWGAQQSPVQFQRTAALEGTASPAGPSARPPEGNGPAQHTVCLRHGHIHRYVSFTLQKKRGISFGSVDLFRPLDDLLIKLLVNIKMAQEINLRCPPSCISPSSAPLLLSMTPFIRLHRLHS